MIVPDGDGIGPYEKWRADLFAAIGYIGEPPPSLPDTQPRGKIM